MRLVGCSLIPKAASLGDLVFQFMNAALLAIIGSPFCGRKASEELVPARLGLLVAKAQKFGLLGFVFHNRCLQTLQLVRRAGPQRKGKVPLTVLFCGRT